MMIPSFGGLINLYFAKYHVHPLASLASWSRWSHASGLMKSLDSRDRFAQKYVLPRSATRKRINKQFAKKNQDNNISLKQLRQILMSFYGYLSHTQDTKTFAHLKQIYYQSYLLYYKYKEQ